MTKKEIKKKKQEEMKQQMKINNLKDKRIFIEGKITAAEKLIKFGKNETEHSKHNFKERISNYKKELKKIIEQIETLEK